MMNKRAFLRIAASSVLVGVALLAAAAPASSQATADISFSSDLPRTLVFVAEEGDAGVAARSISDFLREAGFPLIDPALAHSASQRDLVQRALGGDEGAATDLGRDFGAQLLVIGRADWGARQDPVDGTLITATSEVAVRALRLDRGRVISSASADSRTIEVTEQAAKTKVIREATAELLTESSFVGQLMNNWVEVPWEDTEYWRPDPGSLPARVAAAQGGQAPALAILLADARPATEGAATRGLGVVQKGNQSSSIFNPIRLEGVVVGDARDVQVEGKPANLVDLSEDEARRLGLEGQDAKRFWAEMNLPMSQDTVRVTARGPGGAVAEAVAAPRVDERWAVVVGVGQYRSEDIPDLEFATADAQAIHDFLTSSAAGPFEEDHVLFLTDEQATGSAIREALFVFLQQADWDDLVVIYFAGHGAPDPNRPDNLYLLPHDSDLNALAATGFPMWDVKTALRRQISAERVIVIADACHSAGTQEELAGPASSNPIAGGFAQLFTPSRRLSITAADSNEFSMEDARWGGHGVFTFFFLEALEGKGDLDGNGIVTFSEAYEYVSNSVISATEGRQNPQRAGWGDVPLAVVESGGGTLR
ncbi:caspase domain-containing protein [Gemmatimonadota bacterium]